ncbi:aspartate-semialdehyde dehydrogenase [Clostridium sp. D2Q-11]|uniref:Aspartate-semialdehyde dehydrogenase n=1 Tax=Anaeromonas frigoriresistens TaxID=2683708 RepID=A0A942UV89_9FIRM|nr:aspartate-semialdehyde dehydrogenase [Anaeromonas frigoriresistens]MBS4539218.1 aspartate-semialdehyde dehydrogenase [Anaeromonas frigoriresistens]
MINVAIVGATGMVGRTFLKILEERDFPIDKLYLFASKKSKGNKLIFKNKEYTVEELTEDSFRKDIQIALFSAGGEISKKFAPIAKDNGVIVVDNSSAWRMYEDVPLIVPEVNPEEIKNHNGIIANPNCSTIQSVLPLKPIDDIYGIKRVIYSTYQAVSGSGLGGIKDLEEGVKGSSPKKYPHPIAYNCLPHIDVFMDNGYTKEEMKMINETQKILNKKDLAVTATTVRIPVRYGHCVSINIELEKDFEINDLVNHLMNFEGIKIMDDISQNIYPTALHVEGKDEVYIGRIRIDYSVKHGVNLWVAADNIRKGAATNTVQIAELLVKEYFNN